MLAGELAAADGDDHRALALYEREPRSYVSKGQGLAERQRHRAHRALTSQIWLRNQLIRGLPYMPWRGLLAGCVVEAATPSP